MKKKIIALLIGAIVISSSPVSANGFADQYEKKLETRNKQLGITESTRVISAILSEQKINGFIVPTVGQFTSKFGWRDIGSGQEFHKGVDIANAIGTDIKASAPGQVTFSGFMNGYGNVVMLKHTIQNKEYATVYAHLSLSNVLVGQEVSQGQSIAKMGNTGRSTGSHLHFEVHEGNWNGGRTNAVDPQKYIDL